MDIKIYNTLSRSVEIFKPIAPNKLTLYSCGPTLYDTPHIGNYRTFIFNDFLRRVFLYNGYDVNHTMNITDVDDKTIRKSRELGVSILDLRKKYETLFMQELDSLNMLVPTNITRATDFIQAMIDLTADLIDKGLAYQSKDGIYMSISKVPHYGELAGLKPDSISKERVSNDEYDKEDARDFALWKFRTDDDGDNYWPAPFGEGRPGWHIECSAMAMKIFGPTLDIHTGAIDLIFPHHTNEIAQSESSTGKTFVNYWVHGAFMNVSDEKMAKSKGNFLKLSDLVEAKISPLSYRYWLMTAHYRSQVNFTFEAVLSAQKALIHLIETAGQLPGGGKIDQGYQYTFHEVINNDFNLPEAVALVWKLLKDKTVNDADKKATILDFDRVLGLKLDAVPVVTSGHIPDEIIALSEARDLARAEKDWVKSDALRKEIQARGYDVRDSGGKTEIFEI